MNFFKNIWNKINKPHGIWLAVFYVMFFIVLAATLTLVILVQEQSLLHYVLYCLAAIMLAYFVYTIIIFAPNIKGNTVKLLKKYKFTNALLNDFGFRTVVFGFISLVINLAYLAFVFTTAIVSKNVWYMAISVYYVVLSLMKTKVLYGKRKHETKIKEIKTLKFNGIMLILLTLAFSGVMVLIYKQSGSFEYAGLLIYVVATFTFYKLTLAIINFIKSKKQDDLYIENMKNINLSSALISIIILQVALFEAFSPESNFGVANALTGAGVSAIILTLGILMILKANKKMKEINKKEAIPQEDLENPKSLKTEKIQK